ncbi:PAS domain S-box protein [Fulvivirga sp.]|uniref:PAS domain S-box protein n=1 Tax=Fulvivirga sp. TaxID=1931237 RepID=UPI0032EDB6F5
MRRLKSLNTKDAVLAILFAVSALLLIVELIFIDQEWVRVGLVLAMIGFAFFLILNLSNRISIISAYASEVDRNVLPKNLKAYEKEKAVQKLNSIYYKINEITDFVNNLGTKEYEFKHVGADDEIGKMLKELAKKQSKYIEDERRRNWKNEGLAKFSELLRMDEKSLTDLSFTILSNLVHYVGANQGGFFIENEDDGGRYMNLTACYAYDRKKFVESKVEVGQGLLGQVMLEKEMIMITDVPSDFVTITSGLGEATPNVILILPLIVNDKFYGAIEMASFQIFEDYQIEFLNDVAENIASTVAAVKVNEQTSDLLKQSQNMAQELQSREEEMRQNMEELQATQEEMERNKVELDGIFGALNSSQGLVEFDTKGNILVANEMIGSMLGYTSSELKELPHLLLPKSKESDFWSKLEHGNDIQLELNVRHKNGHSIWLSANYSPVVDKNDDFKKVLTLFLNITARKEREREFEKLSLVADNTNNAVIITDKDQRIEYVNHGFTRLTKYTHEEVVGKKPGKMLQGPDTDKETVSRIRNKIAEGEALYEEILNYDKYGNSYWISIAINPVYDSLGEIDKYISVQADITETKMKALDFQNKLEAIDRSNAVIEFDMQGTILTANDNFLKIVGYEREEIVDKHHSIFLTKEDAEKEEYSRLWETLNRGEFINHEFKRIDKFNNQIWLRGIYNPLLDINGRPFKVVKFATDITKEKQLFIQTAKQSKELSSHLETLNKTIATLEFDASGTITSANQVYLDISGYSLDDLVGNNYDVLLTEEERQKPQNQMMWQSLMEGHFFTGQFKQKSKEEKDLWLLGTFNPVLSDRNEIESIKMFAQFNTLEKEKEIDNAKILGIYNSVLPVIELDSNGLCKKANEYFHSEFGLSRLELRNKSINQVFEVDFSTTRFNEIIGELIKGQVIEELVSHVSDEGNIKIFRAIFNPIRKKQGELSRILLVLIDKEMIVKISPQ